MIEYYCKFLQDHPLITYLEDAFAQFDFPNHKALREKLSNELPAVNMALKQVFAHGGLQRFKYVTDFQEFAGPKVDADAASQPGAEASAVDSKADSKKAKDKNSTPADKKKTPKDEVKEENNQDFPVQDANDPNKNKVTPDCAHVQMNSIQTMSQLLKYFVHATNLEEDLRFTIVIDDCQMDSYLFTEIVDLGIGVGAQYVLLKGCQKNEKIAKIQRFAHIKSAQADL